MGNETNTRITAQMIDHSPPHSNGPMIRARPRKKSVNQIRNHPRMSHRARRKRSSNSRRVMDKSFVPGVSAIWWIV